MSLLWFLFLIWILKLFGIPFLLFYFMYKKALLCYNLFWSHLVYYFLSGPLFIRLIPRFILQYLCVVFHCVGNLHVWVPVCCLCLVDKGGAGATHDLGGGGGVRSCRWRKDFIGCARKIILARYLLCQAKADPRSQSVSWYRRGMGRWDP